MDKEQFLKTGLLEQYVLGLTSEEESEMVQHYAKLYPEVEKEMEHMRDALEDYAMKYITLPPDELKSRVKSSLKKASDEPEPPASQVVPKTKSSFFSRSSALLLLLILGLGFFSYLFYQDKTNAERNYKELAIAFDTYKSECEKQQQQAANHNAVYDLLQHSATQPVKLLGSDLAPEAEAVAYLNPVAQKALINLTKLPSPPSGKTYQLWADVEGHMVDMGIVEFGKGDFQIVTFIQNAESLNITLEPTGGSEEPTVEFLYANGKV